MSITRALTKLSQVGISMIVPIILCLLIGKWLDQKLGTGIIFLIVFIVLGVGAAFRNLYFIVMREYAKEQKKEDLEREKFNYKNDNQDNLL